jgi:4-amino-4-deoxy-L-arabinose transferase-like glycosyltransferase
MDVKSSFNVESYRKPLLIFIVLVAAVSVFVVFDPKLSVGGDNATYVSLSRSLLQGRGYIELWSPGMGPHLQYPPGYPALMAVWVFLFPNTVIPLKIMSSLLFISSILLLYLLWRKRINDTAIWLVLLLLAINAIILEFTHLELTEIPCLFFVIVALILIDRWQSRDSVFNLDFLLAVISLAAVFYIRPQALMVPIGVGLYLLLKRQYLRAIMMGSGTD